MIRICSHVYKPLAFVVLRIYRTVPGEGNCIYRDQVSLQEQECAFLCVEVGMNEDEAKLEAPTFLPAVRPSWSLIP